MTQSKIDDGGLAFPGSRYEQVGTLADHGGDDHSPTYADVTYPGMSLRDWFAGQSLAGMFHHSGWINTIDCDQTEVATRAYAIADAMLEARREGA